jgi:hypothetical protein
MLGFNGHAGDANGRRGGAAPAASVASSGDHFHSWQPLLAISDMESKVRRVRPLHSSAYG